MKVSFILFSLLAFCQGSQFTQFKQEMETKVTWIAGNISEAFQKRCSSSIVNCEVKSYNLCEGTGERQCLIEFPTPEGCVSEGILFSPESGIRLPNAVDLSSLNTRQRQFICSSATVTEIFQLILDQNKNRHSYAYFGSSTGAFRVLPSFKENQIDGNCYEYDPRRRPWYVSAMSGGKNIIILLDISGSMDGPRITNAKKAVKAIIDTMSAHDFVGCVAFESDAKIVGGFSSIKRATLETKEGLINDIDSLTVKGKTNYEAAIEKAFDLLISSIQDELGSPCQETVFLFMTDGSPTEGKTTSTELIELIDNKLNQTNNMILTFMSYAFGVDLDITTLSEISCEYKGILFQIQDATNILDELSNYYLFLAEGAKITQPIWSQPYEDSFGLGEIVTVSMPVYFFDQNNIRTILGVSAIDILMSQLSNYELNKSQAISSLFREQACFESLQNACDLESLRLKENSQSICNISCQNISSQTIAECTRQITRDVFKEPLNSEQDEDKCCGLTEEELKIVLGVVLGVGGAIIVGIIIWRCVVWQKGDNKKQPQSKKEKRDFNSIEKFLKAGASKDLYKIESNEQIYNEELKEEEEEENEEQMYAQAKKAGIQIYPYEPFG